MACLAQFQRVSVHQSRESLVHSTDSAEAPHNMADQKAVGQVGTRGKSNLKDSFPITNICQLLPMSQRIHITH